MEIDFVGSEDKPEDKGYDTNNDQKSAEYLEDASADAVEETAAAAAEWVAAAPAAVAWAVVGF